MDHAQFDPKHSDKAAYKLWITDTTRFNDLDALGHVSSVRINEFFATARTTLFQQAIPAWPKSPQVPVLKLSVVQHEAEIGFPQKLDIGLSVERFGTKSVTLICALFADNTCVALCRNVFVFIDSATRQSVVPADEIKQAFLKIAG